jgi:hypothetical protein
MKKVYRKKPVFKGQYSYTVVVRKNGWVRFISVVKSKEKKE